MIGSVNCERWGSPISQKLVKIFSGKWEKKASPLSRTPLLPYFIALLRPISSTVSQTPIPFSLFLLATTVLSPTPPIT